MKIDKPPVFFNAYLQARCEICRQRKTTIRPRPFEDSAEQDEWLDEVNEWEMLS
jgi:hypothetical protein